MTTTRTRARAVAQEAANEETTDAAVASHPLEDDVMEEVEAPVDDIADIADVKDKVLAACESRKRTRTWATTVASLARDVKAHLERKVEDEEEAETTTTTTTTVTTVYEKEWVRDLHEAAVTMHNAVLMNNHAAYDGEEVEDGEEPATVADVHECEDAVADLCETWVYSVGWVSQDQAPSAASSDDLSLGSVQCHALAARTLPWLLVQSLTRMDANGGEWCKRSSKFALKTMALFDWCDESAVSLKRLLLRALFCPPFVRLSLGRKMLSRCLCLDPNFSREIVAVMRNQLLSGRKSLADHYGDVVFLAWKQMQTPCAEGRAAMEAECLAVLEDDLLPGLVRSCLHARTLKLSDILRRLLRATFYQKRTKLVACEEGILRTHEPLIFRALSSCNAMVRRNACALLTEAFPLAHTRQSSHAHHRSLEEWKGLNERLLAKQTQAFCSLLEDDFAEVRQAACRSVGLVLRDHWDMLAAADVKALVNRVVELTHDASHAGVRSAGLQALGSLMDCVHACDALRKALPGVLSKRCLDPAKRVRLAALDLVVSLKESKGAIVPFYEAVPADVLLGLLAQDKEQEVRQKVARVLAPSYVPSEEEGASLVMGLLQHRPQAAQGLCLCACKAGLSSSTVARIARDLATHLICASEERAGEARGRKRKAPARRKRGAADVAPNDDAAEGEAQEAMAPPAWCQVVRGVTHLFGSLFPEDAEAARDCLAHLNASTEGCALLRLLDLAPSDPARALVIDLAALFPPKECPGVVRACKTRVFAFGEMGAEVAASLRALCSWDMAREVAGEMAAHLGSQNDKENRVTPDPKRRRKALGLDKTKAHEAATMVDYVACVLHTKETRKRFVREESCEEVIEGLQRALAPTLTLGSPGAPGTPWSEAKRGVHVLCKLALHVSRSSGKKEVAGRVFAHLADQMDRIHQDTGEGRGRGRHGGFVEVVETILAHACDAFALEAFGDATAVEAQVACAGKMTALALGMGAGDDAEEEEEAGAGLGRQMKRFLGMAAQALATQGGDPTTLRDQWTHAEDLKDFGAVFQTLSLAH